MLPLCKEEKIAVIPYSPLAGEDWRGRQQHIVLKPIKLQNKNMMQLQMRINWW